MASAAAPFRSPFPGFSQGAGPFRVGVGSVRVVMRGPMFPVLEQFADGSLNLWAQAAEEGGTTRAIRSTDRGETWRPLVSTVHDGQRTWHADGVGPNLVTLADGLAVGMGVYTKPVANEPGWYSATRWESADHGASFRGPLPARLYLPPDRFSAERVQWFHGNTVRLADGSLLAALQGVEGGGRDYYPFRVFVARSADRGVTWEFLAEVASLATVQDPDGRLKGCGFHLHGPCEPCLVHLGDGRLWCAMRVVNDDDDPPLAPAQESYHDLATAVVGSGIHPGVFHQRSPPVPDRYYAPGPPSAPLLSASSGDGGRTWSAPQVMTQAVGCFPRLARSGRVTAMSYGALAFPRWGNCVAFSADDGQTWTEGINFGPFFTTGYSDIVTVGPGEFLCVCDCTPPQPWKNHAAHWVGAVNVSVTPA